VGSGGHAYLKEHNPADECQGYRPIRTGISGIERVVSFQPYLSLRDLSIYTENTAHRMLLSLPLQFLSLLSLLDSYHLTVMVRSS